MFPALDTNLLAAFDETIVNRKTKDLNNGTVGAPPTPKF